MSLASCLCVCFSKISGQSTVVWKEPFTPTMEGKHTLTATLTNRNIKVTPRFTPPQLTCYDAKMLFFFCLSPSPVLTPGTCIARL